MNKAQLTPEQEQLAFADMKDNELVAYWNILMFYRRCIHNNEEHNKRHEGYVKTQLDLRNIPNEDGKRIIRRNPDAALKQLK